MDWKVESYQLAFFHSPLVVQDAFQVWMTLFNSSPDGYQRGPDPQARVSQATGGVTGYTWQVTGMPGRLDLHVLPNAPDPMSANEPFPTIANDEAACDLIAEKAALLVNDHLGVMRVAFVAQLSANVADRPAANNLFAKLTKVLDIPANATDVIFNINMRKTLDSGLIVNRLCRWQAVEKQLLQIQMTGHLGGAADMISTTAQPAAIQPAVMLNIDVNTTPQQVPIKPAAIVDIIRELIAQSRALRLGGYDALVA